MGQKKVALVVDDDEHPPPPPPAAAAPAAAAADAENGGIWYVEPGGGNSSVVIILPEQRGNAMHLHTAVRKYTGAPLTVVFNETTRHRQHVAKVDYTMRWVCYGRSVTT
jgi:hypothetical protein